MQAFIHLQIWAPWYEAEKCAQGNRLLESKGILHVFHPNKSCEPDRTTNNLLLPNKGGGPLQNLTSVVFKKWRVLNRTSSNSNNLTYRERNSSVNAKQSELNTWHPGAEGREHACHRNWFEECYLILCHYEQPNKRKLKKKNKDFNWYRALVCPQFSSFYDIQLLKCAWQHIQGLWNALTKDWGSKRELCDLASVTVVIWPSSPPFISFYSASQFNHLRLLDSSVCYLFTVVIFVFYFPTT